jgi:hypothetical protein
MAISAIFFAGQALKCATMYQILTRCCQILELSAFFSRTNCASQDDAAKRQLAAKEPHGFEAEIDGSWSDIVFFKMFN